MIQFVESTKNIKVVISREFYAQTQYLCKVNPNTEWSGIMIYDVIKGDIDKPEKLVIKPLYVLLIDIGSAVTTDFNYDEEYAKFKMAHKEYIGKPIGKIHSHNTMATTPSGTDYGDLKDLSVNYNIYVSLVTNNRGEFSGITSIKEEEEFKGITTIINTLSGKTKKKEKKGAKNTIVTIYKNDIEIDGGEVSEEFKQRYDEVKEKIEKARFSSHSSFMSNATQDSLTGEITQLLTLYGITLPLIMVLILLKTKKILL